MKKLHKLIILVFITSLILTSCQHDVGDSNTGINHKYLEHHYVLSIDSENIQFVSFMYDSDGNFYFHSSPCWSISSVELVGTNAQFETGKWYIFSYMSNNGNGQKQILVPCDEEHPEIITFTLNKEKQDYEQDYETTQQIFAMNKADNITWSDFLSENTGTYFSSSGTNVTYEDKQVYEGTDSSGSIVSLTTQILDGDNYYVLYPYS